jgi:FixJ family two-component response regulator
MMAPRVIRIVDDDDAYRAALTRLLEAAGFSVRGYASAGEFLLDERGTQQPGCLLLDVCMPGPSGLELHDALARRGDALPVVYLTARGDVPTSVRAMKSGAVDFLQKPVPRTTLLAAIETALDRDAAERAARTRRGEIEERYASLTTRERDVVDHVVTGRLNKQIAALLGMAERTVKAHRAQAMSKLRVESLAELVDLMRELRPPPSQH